MTTTASSPGHGQQAVEMVTAIIDGVQVQVPKGTLVIRAAEEIGVQIPRFCDHPLLDPVGACRQCLVEVAMPGRDGQVRSMPKPQPACTMVLSEGMQVQTQASSPVAEKAQHGIMEFLLINHPLDCPVCDKGGECPLQNQAMSNGRETSRFVDVKRTFPKPIKISTQVLLDRERCILCQRCTRFSDEIAGDPFIDLQMRGAQQQVGIFDPEVLGLHTEGPAMESVSGEPFASYFSGNTIQICPVGALTSAAYRFRSRPFDLVSTPSVCEHCSSGCSLRVDHRRGTVLRRMAGKDMDVNEEWNCDKGRFAFHYPTLPDRLERPLVRDAESGELREATWPEALEAAAVGLAAAKVADEDVFGEELDTAPGVGVLVGGRHTLEDAYGYSKFARTVLGTNDIDFRNRAHSAEEQHFLGYHVAGRTLDQSATYADLENADAVLLVGLEPEEEAAGIYLRLRKAVRKKGLRVLTVAPFASRGVRKLRGTVISAAPGTEPEVVSALTTSHEEVADEAAVLREGRTVVLVGERAADVNGLYSAAAKLAEEISAPMAWIPRRSGDRAAVETGCLPALLPGGRVVEDPAARAQVATFWGVEEIPSSAGRSAQDIAAAVAAKELCGLIAAGLDYRDAADPQVLLDALGAAPFVVAMDVRRTPVTDLADVVFPVAPAAEKNGTFLNWESRERHLTKALASRAMSDVRVLSSIAEYMDADEVFGLYDVQDAKAELDRLPAWDGNRVPAPRTPSRPPQPPLRGRAVVASWHMLLDAGLMQDGEPHLAGTAHQPVARLSPGMAEQTGVEHGSSIELTGRGGRVVLPTVVTEMPDGVVWVPATCGGVVMRDIGIFAGGMVSLAKATDADQEGVDA